MVGRAVIAGVDLVQALGDLAVDFQRVSLRQRPIADLEHAGFGNHVRGRAAGDRAEVQSGVRGLGKDRRKCHRALSAQFRLITPDGLDRSSCHGDSVHPLLRHATVAAAAVHRDSEDDYPFVSMEDPVRGGFADPRQARWRNLAQEIRQEGQQPGRAQAADFLVGGKNKDKGPLQRS